MKLLPLTVVVCLLLSFLLPFLHRVLGRRLGRVLAVVPFVFFLSLLRLMPAVARGGVFRWSYPWIPALDVGFSFYLDGLGLLFALLVSGVGTLVLYYAAGYLDPDEDHGKFFAFMLLFMAAMFGVVLAENLLLMFLFWELTSVSSFLLIGFWNHRDESRYGALKALLVTAMGGLCLMAGLIVIYVATGTMNLSALVLVRDELVSHPWYPVALVLLLIAAFTKSAQAPFHLWLPNAMEAPTPVSAYLHSAAMVKAGIYLIARMSPILGGTDLWYLLVSGVGIVTLALGSFLALRQTDMKAILAFSTVSQLGLIIALFGWGTPLAVTAGVFHTLNHSMFKAALFMATGIVDHAAHTRDIRRLGQLAKAMPITAIAMGLGALALAGVPPFNGFVSKEMFFAASMEQQAGGGPLGALTVAFPLLAVVGSTFTFVYSLILYHGVFYGARAPQLEASPHDPEPGLWVPPLLLGGGALLVGLVPGLVDASLVAPAAAAVLRGASGPHLALWHGVNVPLLMSLAVIGVGMILYRASGPFVRFLHGVPGRINVNAVYDWAVEALVTYSERLTNRMMTGFTRDYFGWFMGFFLGVLILGLAVAGGISLRVVDLAPVSWYELLIVGMALAGGLGLLWLRTRMAAVASLSLVGLAMLALYVVFRAPDLAMTNLIVEIASLVLVLLAFVHLPRLREEAVPPAAARANALISIGSGAAVTALMLGALAQRTDDFGAARYFLEYSRELGGGYNVVNVILVDFRGLDTMGEITVLGLAALGVYMLLNLRARRGSR